jgi:hypothetical protein
MGGATLADRAGCPEPAGLPSRPVAATVEDVAAIAVSLPDVTEGVSYGHRTWCVRKKAFVWIRPFSKADLRRFGDTPPPAGDIVAVRVEDLGEKDAVIAASSPAFFTIPHFDGFAAVLIQLSAVSKRALRDAIVDAWLAMAPPSLAREHADRLMRRT